MKKVYFGEEKSVGAFKRLGYWIINVGLFILLAVVSAAAVCLTIALL